MAKKRDYITDNGVSVDDLNVLTVYESTDYSMLKFAKENRFIDPSQGKATKQEIDSAEKRIANVIKMMGDYAQKKKHQYAYLFDKNMAIKVGRINGELIIFDGQHRYVAAKQLGIPYYFELLDIDTMEEGIDYMLRRNKTKTQWTFTQYLGVQERCGNIFAKALIEIQKRYNIPPQSMIYFCGKDLHKPEKIMSGTFPTFDIEEMFKVASNIFAIATNLGRTEKERSWYLKDEKFVMLLIIANERGKKEGIDYYEVLFKKTLNINERKIRKPNTFAYYAYKFGLSSMLTKRELKVAQDYEHKHF